MSDVRVYCGEYSIGVYNGFGEVAVWVYARQKFTGTLTGRYTQMMFWALAHNLGELGVCSS